MRDHGKAKHWLFSATLALAAATFSLPAEARFGGFGGFRGGMGGFHGGFHRAGFMNPGFAHRGFVRGPMFVNRPMFAHRAFFVHRPFVHRPFFVRRHHRFGGAFAAGFVGGAALGAAAYAPYYNYPAFGRKCTN